MTDKSTPQSPDPAATDFMQKSTAWFGAQRQYVDCRLSWWGLKSRFGICNERELKAKADAADAVVTEAEKRLLPTGPKPQ
jgi:hypothetical protein